MSNFRKWLLRSIAGKHVVILNARFRAQELWIELWPWQELYEHNSCLNDGFLRRAVVYIARHRGK